MREQKILTCFPKFARRSVFQATVQKRGFLINEVRVKHIRSELGESKLSMLRGKKRPT